MLSPAGLHDPYWYSSLGLEARDIIGYIRNKNKLRPNSPNKIPACELNSSLRKPPKLTYPAINDGTARRSNRERLSDILHDVMERVIL